MKLVIRPLTAELWPAFEDLFADSPVCSRCWCMAWRVGPSYRERAGKVNKAAFKSLVKDGPPPGLLAFDGDVAVGWCQVTPRDDVPALDRAWRLARVDDVPVWSLSCFYTRKGYRKRGVTQQLIAAAVGFARKAGAPAVEAYPVDRRLSPSSTSTGVATTFEKAGFVSVARHTPPRPIMRYELRSPSSKRRKA